MATTTNYGWETPDDTDLVKDGAAAIRTLGSSIDTTTKNLNPETTTGDIAYRSATANTNTRLAIGSTGQVLTVAAGVPSWATPATTSFVGCSLADSAVNGQSIANNTYTALTWDLEDYDTDSFHSTVTNTDRITIPTGKGGKYQVTAIANWGSNTAGQRVMKIYKNGAAFKGAGLSPAAGYPGNVVTCTINLVATDYLSVYVFQNSGSAQDCSKAGDAGHFSVTYLGA